MDRIEFAKKLERWNARLLDRKARQDERRR